MKRTFYVTDDQIIHIKRMIEKHADLRTKDWMVRILKCRTYTVKERFQLNKLRHWYNFFHVEGNANQDIYLSQNEMDARMRNDGYDEF